MDLLNSLSMDMETCPRSFQKSATWWMLPQQLAQATTMADLMSIWCGNVGQLPISDLDRIVNISGNVDFMTRYENFLRSIDHQNLLQGFTIK